VKKRTVFALLSLGWMALIFSASSVRDVPGPDLFQGQDKLMHAAVFGVLALLYARTARGEAASVRLSWALIAAVAAAAYGALDEFHQSFVPGRDASFADLAADGAGAFLAAWIHWMWDRRSGEPDSLRSSDPPFS